jgi:hypothetical protein
MRPPGSSPRRCSSLVYSRDMRPATAGHFRTRTSERMPWRKAAMDIQGMCRSSLRSRSRSSQQLWCPECAWRFEATTALRLLLGCSLPCRRWRSSSRSTSSGGWTAVTPAWRRSGNRRYWSGSSSKSRSRSLLWRSHDFLPEPPTLSDERSHLNRSRPRSKPPLPGPPSSHRSPLPESPHVAGRIEAHRS